MSDRASNIGAEKERANIVGNALRRAKAWAKGDFDKPSIENADKRDRQALISTSTVLGMGLFIYGAIAVWQVVNSYQNPVLTSSLSEEPFPIPNIVLCGFCHNNNSAEACGTVECQRGHLGVPDEVQDCNSWLSPLSSDNLDTFANYSNIVVEANDLAQAPNCVVMEPEGGETFVTGDYDDKIYLIVRYDKTGDEFREDNEIDPPIDLVWGVSDINEPITNLAARISSIRFGNEFVTISRVQFTPIVGTREFSIDVPSSRAASKEFLPFVSLEVSVGEFKLREEAETPAFGVLAALGSFSGALSAILFLYQRLLGNWRIGPWGLVHTRVTRTSPPQLCRYEGLEPSIVANRRSLQEPETGRWGVTKTLKANKLKGMTQSLIGPPVLAQSPGGAEKAGMFGHSQSPTIVIPGAAGAGLVGQTTSPTSPNGSGYSQGWPARQVSADPQPWPGHDDSRFEHSHAPLSQRSTPPRAGSPGPFAPTSTPSLSTLQVTAADIVAIQRRQDALERVLTRNYCMDLEAAMVLELRRDSAPIDHVVFVG